MPLSDEPAFFDALRNGLMAPALNQTEVDGAKAVLVAAEGAPVSWAAYMLATAFHETAHTMQPVREAHWLSKDAANRYFFRMYDRKGQRPKVAARLSNTQDGDGVKFCGRGYVQLTGRGNYTRAAGEVGADLVGRPELALDQAIAAKVMRRGMQEGWFTGRTLADYLPARGYVRARAIINGTDQAQLIAGYARRFEAALTTGGWA